MKSGNPFLITGYRSPDYFCDREEETNRLMSALENGRSVTLLSLRRMGKTGLIKHLFYQIKKRPSLRFLYLDLMPTTNMSELVRDLGTAILQDEQKRSKGYLKKISRLLLGIQGKVTLNPGTGMPEVELGFNPKVEEIENNISALFDYLNSQNIEYIIAMDEFQQILNYPEKNVEAVFRKYSQLSPNVRFIFSGSNKHLLSSMFSDYGRPFYQSTDILFLERLNLEVYAAFIENHFAAGGIKITNQCIVERLKAYDNYTFYVQYFFNKLYALHKKTITENDINEVAREIVFERESIYYNYKNLLTNNQFALLRAMARDGGVREPNAGGFIRRHNLPQPSSVNRALHSLIAKEMIYEEGGVYKVYDLFFSQWLSWL